MLITFVMMYMILHCDEPMHILCDSLLHCLSSHWHMCCDKCAGRTDEEPGGSAFGLYTSDDDSARGIARWLHTAKSTPTDTKQAHCSLASRLIERTAGLDKS